MTKMTGKKQPAAPLTELEKIRAKTMMRNHRIFQSLGIDALLSMIRKSNDGQEESGATSHGSTNSIPRAESLDYNPRDDVIDEEEVDENVVDKTIKVSRRKKSGFKKTSNKRKCSYSEASAPMAPGRVMAIPPGGSKRLLELEQPARARVTRSKATLVTNHEKSRLSMNEENTMCMDLSPVAPTRASNQAQQQLDGDDEGILTVVKPRIRKGTGLERMTKSLGTKVRIEIAKGTLRPGNPLRAAKLATEGGLIARSHTPVLPHFKEYKKNKSLMDDYMGKVAANFEMDTDSEIVKASCTTMLQRRSKNRHHLIKKEFFDKVPANQASLKSPVPGMPDDEWQMLTTLWTTPKHKKICESNKHNRAKVQFQQKTGSRSYTAHIYALERKGELLSAIDYFKATHNGKAGYSEPVQKAIAEMEKRMVAPLQEGQEQKSATAVVAEVLTEQRPASTFLMNVGLQSSSSRNKFRSDSVVAAQVTDLKEKLERSEEQGKAMREELAVLKKKSEEAEAAQAARDREYKLRFARLAMMMGGGTTLGN